ncbi:cytochrome P450 [Rickenella mellea]|uniref:Cytochrome P450 n=1 Tax=Rickenella mellea TaxID=50990 RepID=A0A4Y7PZ80_9AGAM|nr:cytochrome P450 [Rickenella mellea]
MLYPPWHLVVALCLTYVFLHFQVRHWRRARLSNPRRLPLPPGPIPSFLIGNLRDIPSRYPWLKYSALAKQYGDIVHVEVFGKHILILNSLEGAVDLCEKRSHIYSDRPRMPMVGEMMGWDINFTLMPYGPRWRRHRRLFHQNFNGAAVQSYIPVQAMEVHRMMQRLLSTPEDLFHHIRQSFAAAIMRVTYGMEVQGPNRHVKAAEDAMKGFADAAAPGAYLVDTIPILKYVPAWFPGATFVRKAQEWRKSLNEFVNGPFLLVKNDMAAGTGVPSICRTALEKARGSAEEDSITKNTCAMAFAGGSDTTTSTIQSFFLAMVLHPEIQKKAQEQIDSVVGRDRLPEFSDRVSLPYVEAIIKETLRWQPAGPMGVPHQTTADDEYKGYHIPKGAMILINAWSILNDDTAYPDPFAYNPERFLKDGQINPNVRDPEVAAFGFGRRICPGRHLVSNGAFLSIASILAAFDISHAIDEHGNQIEVEVRMTTGILSYPEPFKCSIRPRSETVPSMIQQSIDRDFEFLRV